MNQVVTEQPHIVCHNYKILPVLIIIARSALVFCGSKLDCMSVGVSVCLYGFFLSFSGHI